MTPGTRGWVVIHEEECTGCGLCVAVCPVGALEVGPGLAGRVRLARFAADGCRADGLCRRSCPQPGAIQIVRGLA